VVGSDPGERARVHREALEQPARPHPETVEREHRQACGKGGRRRRATELHVQPAQRAAPQEPLVQVAHQHGRQVLPLVKRREQAADLAAALVRQQAEMGRQNSQPPPAAVEHDVERAARLVRRDAEVDPGDREDRIPREQHVAVLGVAAEHRHAADRFGREAVAEELHEVAAGGAPLHLLQRDHVRPDLGQDVGDALRIGCAVAPDGAVDVVGRDHASHGAAGAGGHLGAHAGVHTEAHS
jgi:hypothetical protein